MADYPVYQSGFTVPRGYEIVGFRIPKVGEEYLGMFQPEGEIFKSKEGGRDFAPRLIVRKTHMTYRGTVRNEAGRYEPNSFDFDAEEYSFSFYPVSGWYAPWVGDFGILARKFAGGKRRQGTELIYHKNGVGISQDRTGAVLHPNEKWDFEEGCRVCLRRFRAKEDIDNDTFRKIRFEFRKAWYLFNANG
jgi:hypothetical protein